MDKREYLNNLISNFNCGTQVKINKIIGALQKTEDIIIANKLYHKVLNGDLDNIKDKAIDNLIEVFNGDFKSDYGYNNKPKSEEISSLNNQTQDELIKELENIKSQFEQFKNETQSKIKELTKENNILRELTLISNNHTLIDVPDEDINELYVRYMKDGTTVHGKAFIVNQIIPKSYYKL